MRAYQSRQWQSVPESSHGCFEVARLKVLIDVLPMHGRVHVRPDERDGTARNASAFIRNLDGDVFLALHDDHLDGWIHVLFIRTEPLHDRTKRVLEQFEHYMRQMTRDIGEMEVLRTDELYGRRLEHGVVLFAYEPGKEISRSGEEIKRVCRQSQDVPRILDGFMYDLMYVLEMHVNNGNP